MSKKEYFDKFLYEQETIFDTNIFSFPNCNQSSSVIESKIQDDIFLMKNDISLKKDTTIQTNSAINGLLFNVVFNGSTSYDSLLNAYKSRSKSNHTTISAMSKEQGIECFKKDFQTKSLNIILKKSFLEKHLLDKKEGEKIINNLQNKYCNVLLKDTKTNVQTSIIAKQIYSSQFTGSLEKVFLHSKVLELLYLELDSITKKTNISKINPKVKFSPYDIEAIHEAKKILLNNMQNPPSIIELSKQVKLNEFKLKIGFKKFFETTPYKLLHEYRMQKAKTLLETGDFNVTEVSNIIGYKYIHSFSKVFAKKFGVLPKEVMKNTKYYY